jgi:dTDP-4-dehydrorhamnose reductase
METWWTSLKLLITGASGLFGSKLAQMAQEQGIEVYSSDIQNLTINSNFIKMDVTNKEQVEEVFQKVKPDVVVHAASLTDVDKCELNKDLAWKINVEGTKNINQASQQTESFLIYISTDYVFSGEKGNYVESDAADPINYYGLTKLIAEEIISTQPQYLIARPSVIYGATPAVGKINFALWLIETLRKGENAKIVTDQWNTPTLNTSLAEMTLEAINRRLTGTYHLSGATRVSRFEFAKEIADIFCLDKKLITKANSSQFSWSALRPADSSLDTSLAKRNLAAKPIELRDALKRFKVELEQKEG